MFPSFLSSLKSFQSLQLFCAFILIDTQFVAGIRPTDESYNNYVLEPRRAYDDLSSSSSIVEQCPSSIPCHVVTASIRIMRALLNDFEIASKHCQHSHGSEIKSSMPSSRRISHRLQRLRNQKPPLRSASKIQNFGQTVRRLRQDEGSRFPPGQFLGQLPLEPYRHSFDPTSQAYTINSRQIRNLNQSLQLPVAGKFEVEKSRAHNELSSSDIVDTDSKKTKIKKKKACSRRSSTGMERIKPKLSIQEDALTEESEDESNDISEKATLSKNKIEAVTTSFFEATGIDNQTDRIDIP